MHLNRLYGRATTLTLLTVSVLLVSACSSAPAESSNSPATSNGAFPATIEHVYGKTVIDEAPQAVATVGWGSFDAAIALGTIPVTIPTATFGDSNGDGYLEWTSNALADMDAELPPLHDETDGIPYEEIADTAPDLILGANSGLTEQEYETLSKIANTVAYPGAPWGTSWRESTTMVGTALGQESKAKGLIADTEEAMATEMAKYPTASGKTGMVIWVDAKDLGKVQYYTPSDTRVQYLNDLGFATPQSLKDLAANEKGFVGSISAEEADRLDADVAVVYVQGGDLSTLQSDPLLGQIPAIKKGAVAMMTDEALLMAVSAPTVLSIPWALPTYAQMLGEASAKA